MSHIAWAEIDNFYTVRKTVAKYPDLLRRNKLASSMQSTVTYRAKVKLHGTNAGIIVDPKGTVTPISRTNVLTTAQDNVGFARWVEPRAQEFAQFKPETGRLVIFGEWCGPGIMKGVATTQMKEKIFAVFAARIVDGENEIDFITEPAALAGFTKRVMGAYTIPWFNEGEEFAINWEEEADKLQPVINGINAHVQAVENCDPWMKSRFGIEGVGEGLVFYPMSHKGYENFSNLCFKAKGEKHQVVAHTKPAQVDPSVAASCVAFAEMVVTPARLEQALRAVNGGELVFDPKNIGAFLAWVNKDLAKETTMELEASGLDAKMAYKACANAARTWYMDGVKKL